MGASLSVRVRLAYVSPPMGDACVACDVWCVVCDVWCVVYDVCVVCGVLCVSLRAGGVLFKTRTQYRGVLGIKKIFI